MAAERLGGLLGTPAQAPGALNASRTGLPMRAPSCARTAADDDAPLERLHALAWGAGSVVPHPTVMPTEPFPPMAVAEPERTERQTVDHPVLLYEADGWEPDWGRNLTTA